MANQKALNKDDLIGYATRLGLDRAKFAAALDAHTYHPDIDRDFAEAKTQGVFGVPAFFVNSKRVDGVQTVAFFKQIIDQQLNPQITQITQMTQLAGDQ